MRRHIPLNSIRAFECAARHLSLARAADELCVTPTAISHQIRALEARLNAKLFDRRGGRLTLTDTARATLPSLIAGFDLIEDAFAPLMRPMRSQHLLVGASPSVASLWLLPRLQRFRDRHPSIEVGIHTLVDMRELATRSFDISICNLEHVPNRMVEPLMSDSVIAVCAPALLPEDRAEWSRTAARLPLIHDDKPADVFPSWNSVLSKSHLFPAETSSGLRFNQSSLAIEAAIDGHGVLLARLRLVAGAIARKQLVPVLGIRHTLPSYRLVRHTGTPSRAVVDFRDWIVSEADQDDCEVARLLAGLGRATGTRSQTVSAGTRGISNGPAARKAGSFTPGFGQGMSVKPAAVAF